MAPAVSTIFSGGAPQAVRDSEKTIWMIVIPLSIFIPCLIASAICITRHFRRRKTVKAPASRDVPSEVYYQAWLDNMQRINQQHHNHILPPDDAEIKQSLKEIRLHEFIQHTRSQSTPSAVSADCEPSGNGLPLRPEPYHTHLGETQKRDTLELPHLQNQISVTRRGSAH